MRTGSCGATVKAMALAVRVAVGSFLSGGLVLCGCAGGRDTSIACPITAAPDVSPAGHAGQASPLVIGETFTMRSAVMGEERVVNVYVPTNYGEPFGGPLSVLYVLDGGLNEDFLHVAGLVQVLSSNGGMRPHVVVGIPNTVRRRDMTGPTSVAEDLKIAPVVGGSAAFREFLTRELVPEIRARYRVSGESAIVGESLAGLFVMETFFLEPGAFGTFIAIDPSLWWADKELLTKAEARLAAREEKAADGAAQRSTLFMAASSEETLAGDAASMARVLGGHGAVVKSVFVPMEKETHATIYHPAALGAFRAVLGPSGTGK